MEQMDRVSNLYLFVYNSLQAFGWSIALFSILVEFLFTKSLNGAYASAGELICLLQTLAFIEVIHGAIGIVPSGFFFPLLQCAGRVYFLLATVCGINEVQELPAVFFTFVAWCFAEVHVLCYELCGKQPLFPYIPQIAKIKVVTILLGGRYLPPVSMFASVSSVVQATSFKTASTL
ncbi:protein-tyrosine phosphatase-like protein [Tanacetum coccineum]